MLEHVSEQLNSSYLPASQWRSLYTKSGGANYNDISVRFENYSVNHISKLLSRASTSFKTINIEAREIATSSLEHIML